MADDASAFTALAPRLVVHSTSEINALLTSSIHLPNFSTLLSPFKDSVERVNLRTHTLESNVQAARFPLRFDEADQLSPLGPWELHGGWVDQVGSEVQAKAAHWVKQVKGPTGECLFSNPLRLVSKLNVSSTQQTHPGLITSNRDWPASDRLCLTTPSASLWSVCTGPILLPCRTQLTAFCFCCCC